MSPRMVIDQPAGPAEPLVVADPTAELARILSFLGQHDGPDGNMSEAGVSDAERIDQIELLERIKAAAAGAQAAEIVRFTTSQVAAQQAAEVHPRVVGRGIGDQVGLACKLSPTAGSQRVSLARALWSDLPATYTALRAGDVSEYVASLVCRETSHLDQPTRRVVDAQLAQQNLPAMSHRQAAARARRLAHRADPAAAADRARVEETQRRVTIQPAPDTMTILTAYLPAAQGMAAWTALSRTANTATAAGDPRNRHQIMADTLIQRLTGQTTAADVNVEIGLLMPLDTLTDPNSTRPAEVQGYGPIAAPLARELLGSTAATPTAAPPPCRTAAASAPAATTPEKHPAGRSNSFTTDSEINPTPSKPPPPPDTPTPAKHPNRRDRREASD